MKATAALQAKLDAFERRHVSHRHVTIQEATEALADVSELVALIGLHLPVVDDLVMPVLEALDNVTGYKLAGGAA